MSNGNGNGSGSETDEDEMDKLLFVCWFVCYLDSTVMVLDIYTLN